MTTEKPAHSDNSANSPDDLLGIREAITKLDDTLLSLLAKRRNYSLSVAKAKQNMEKPLRDQVREKDLLESLLIKASVQGLESNFVTRVFTSIIEDSVRHQQNYLQSLISPDLHSPQKKSIAVLGGKGAYSYLAAKKFFRQSENTYSACSSFNEIIDKVESAEVEYGVMPIENTTSGGITEVYDLLLSSNLSVVGEEKITIDHCLVSKANVKLKGIREIVAHPQASRQCSDSLAGLTLAKITLAESTAHALEIVAKNSRSNIAAISNEQAAELFGLTVLKKDLANQRKNLTRFLVLSRSSISVSSAVQSKTSIALCTGQEPGSLAEVLTLFKEANIPLSKLESRPIPERPWEQMFYIDLEGNIENSDVAETLKSLAKMCRFLRNFGTYPTEDIRATQVSPGKLANAKLTRDKQTKQSKLTVGRDSTNPSGQTSYPRKERSGVVITDGAKVGDGHFLVIAELAKFATEAEIISQSKQASESGVVVLGCSFSENQDLTEDRSFSIEQVARAASTNKLSVVIEVNNVAELDLVANNGGIPNIGCDNLLNTNLLKSVGQLNCPVVLSCHSSMTIEDYLKAVELVMSQGNLQVILCIREQQSPFKETEFTIDLARIVLLKQKSHLPLLVDLTHTSEKIELTLPLVKAAKAAGADGTFVDFENISAAPNKQSNNTQNSTLLAELMSEIYG
ncbi:MAG: prephenate dehydratase [Kangiellaceae bacterium]|nr:prephenate dehydratase [Kangiellaceae bacterium]